MPINESTALDQVIVGWEDIFTKQKGLKKLNML